MMIYLLYDVFQEGFVYHHAEPDYIMLTYWIPESPSTLPPNASHQVGAGAIVINDKNEVYNHPLLQYAEDCFSAYDNPMPLKSISFLLDLGCTRTNRPYKGYWFLEGAKWHGTHGEQ